MIKTIQSYINADEKIVANTYVVVFENNDALIVDPALLNKNLIRYLKKNKLNYIGTLLTHGHFDHTMGLIFLLKKYPQVPIYIGQNDLIQLTDVDLNASNWNHNPKEHVVIRGNAIGVHEGPLSIGGHDLQVLDTPFHTKGSVCYYFPADKVLFSGDTIMKGVIGRFDLLHADPRRVKDSLLKVIALPDDVTIYPGHDELTSIKFEKENNKFIKKFKEKSDEKN